LVPITAKVADFSPVTSEADYGKAALVIGQVGWANVQETCAVQEFDDIENMSLHADVLIERNRCRLRQVRSRRRRGDDLRQRSACRPRAWLGCGWRLW
jgi:hypothetical protein